MVTKCNRLKLIDNQELETLLLPDYRHKVFE